MNDGQRASSHDQPAIRDACEDRKGTLNLLGIAHVYGAYLDCNGGRHGLNRGPKAKAGANGRITQNRSARDVRRDLLEQLQPFRADAVIEGGC
jgi:hypothetical protein